MPEAEAIRLRLRPVNGAFNRGLQPQARQSNPRWFLLILFDFISQQARVGMVW